MVRTAASPSLFLPFPEYASQPHPYPAVQLGERRFVAVFEIFKPAPQSRIQRSDDHLKALPIGNRSAPRLASLLRASAKESLKSLRPFLGSGALSEYERSVCDPWDLLS